MIRPDFGDTTELQATLSSSSSSSSTTSSSPSSGSTESQSSSSLKELIVVGGAVAVAMTAFLYFTSPSSGEKKKTGKKKKKKKRVPQGNRVAASKNANTTGKSSTGKVAQVATNALSSTPTVASDSVFKNLLKRAPAKEIKRPTVSYAIVPEWNAVEQLLLQGDINKSVQAFLMALSKQSLNYTTDKSKIGRREMVPNAVIMKCIDFFVFENYSLPKVVFAQTYNKFVADLKQGRFPQDALASKSNEKLMHIARFACAFCMNEVKDFANAEKLGWKSKSARLLNGDTEPPPGSVEFLRLMQESRNTKKVLAQLSNN